jgi:CheY-like chemotaxis protein
MENDNRKEILVEILLVEDNPADVNMVRETLKESKIANNLQVVNDGEKALDYLHRRGEFAVSIRPDLILLDLGLPKIGGLEVLENIKDDAEFRRIPVVILTTSKAEEDIIKSYDLHANSYIQKPVHLKEFVEMVKTIEDFWFGIVRLPPK